ncbi:MAG: hypothetical protein ACRDNH_10525 [Gaiellaceae bacterium]
MVDLESVRDYVWLLIVAAAFGAVGGLAYELLLTRGSESGGLERPGEREGLSSFYDLGFLGSMFLGAAAAIAVSYFFTPEVQVKVEENGTEEIKTQWQIVKVVPLSLIVGSAGGAFLSAMQARVLARVKEQEARTARALTEQVATGSKEVATIATAAAVEKVEAEAKQAVRIAAQTTPPELAQRLETIASGAANESEIRDALAQATPADPEQQIQELERAKEEAVKQASERVESAIAEQLETASKSMERVTL